MFRCILFGLLSLSVVSVSAAQDDDKTYHLLDTKGRPVFSGLPEVCIDTPATPNNPIQRFKQCGDVIDTDGDGVFDDEDDCPENTEAELIHGVEANGCPKDTDKDGVADFLDRCPMNTVQEIRLGVNRFGCPKDSDQDGIPDFRDRCLGTPVGAKVDKHGCQEVKREIKQILGADVLFKFDKYNLIETGKAALTHVATDIKAQLPYVRTIVITGHTDSTGSQVYNQTLSEQRANAVATFLTTQGIPAAKVQSTGYGETQPISSNSSKQGRAQNRRVEIHIKMTE
ncbi:OmpA family protein [Candidatus Albibeggiatoa sp. nov. NOAA]|uniref:OmpA family protein n=1 Tax=Candidatus Albibeggiatoa sp. nov. NOAA TaxID=3162724 RepID=UPI0032F38FB0|nr:OmpA family protein [Thiotrichaceae bacterium]